MELDKYGGAKYISVGIGRTHTKTPARIVLRPNSKVVVIVVDKARMDILWQDKRYHGYQV